MVLSVLGTTNVTFHPHTIDGEQSKPLTADFTPPFRRIDMYEELKRLLSTVKMPPADTLHTESALKQCLNGILWELE